MCGISGLVLFGSRLISEREVFISKNFLSGLEHRGPDGHGSWTNNTTVILNHNRLALLDLTNNGAQPMSDVNEKVVVIFNGEIYNFLSLKKELKDLGYIFISDCDTEVLVAGYLIWGVEVFEKIDGMFAIVLHDIRNNKTFIYRDLLGIKPLYYTFKQERLFFASEVNVFKNIDDQIFTQSVAAFTSFNLFGFISEPHTLFNEVKSFEPGVLYCVPNNSTELLILKKNKISDLIIESNQVIVGSKIVDEIKKSVNNSYFSDAKIAVLLSSGVDSNFIYDCLAKHSCVNTVTLFKKESKILEYLKTSEFSSVYDLSPNDLNDFFNLYLNFMDQPTIDGFNIFIISYFMNIDRFKAGILGTGSDELFQGYHLFNQIKLIRNNKFFIRLLLKNKNFVRFVNRFMRNDKITSLNDYLDSDVFLYLFFRSINTFSDFKEKFDEEIFDEGLSKLNLQEIFNNYSAETFQIGTKLRIFDLSFYLRNQLLRDADVFSMRNGIEMRVPFLNKNVLKICLNSNIIDKANLVQNISNYDVRNFLIGRKKTGFDVTNDFIKPSEFLNIVNKRMFSTFSK